MQYSQITICRRSVKLLNEYNELSRGKKKKNKFIIMRDNTMKSLHEVEFFLGNWKKTVKGFRLYKILK